MKIELNRQGKAEVQQYIEYKTSIKHASNVQDTRITVPATLLKIKDLSDSYTELVHIEKQLTDLNHSTKATAQTEESLFELQNQKIKKIETISFIELGLILVIGGFQFYRLRGIIYKRENWLCKLMALIITQTFTFFLPFSPSFSSLRCSSISSVIIL